MKWRLSTVGQRWAARLVAFALRHGASEDQLIKALGVSHGYRDDPWRAAVLEDAKFRNTIRGL